MISGNQCQSVSCVLSDWLTIESLSGCEVKLRAITTQINGLPQRKLSPMINDNTEFGFHGTSISMNDVQYVVELYKLGERTSLIKVTVSMTNVDNVKLHFCVYYSIEDDQQLQPNAFYMFWLIFCAWLVDGMTSVAIDIHCKAMQNWPSIWKNVHAQYR